PPRGRLGLLELDGIPDRQRAHPESGRLRPGHTHWRRFDGARPARHEAARDASLQPRRHQRRLRTRREQAGRVCERSHYVLTVVHQGRSVRRRQDRVKMRRTVRRRRIMRTAFLHSTGKLVLLLALLFGALDDHAQGRGKISGKVTDAATGEALPGVNVVIDGTTMGTATDLEGDYFIANLQPGEYTLRVSSIGFKPTTIQGII